MRTRFPRIRDRRRQRGQGLVEMALVLPIFLLGVFGLIDGSQLVYLNSTLSQAAREGARLGSVEASWIGSTDTTCSTTGGPVCPSTSDAFRADIVQAVNRMTVPFSVPTANVAIRCDATTPPTGAWTGQSCTSPSTGGYVSVRVTYTYVPLTPIIGQILGQVPVSGAATMVIN